MRKPYESYKRECQGTFFPVGSVLTPFLSRHSAQPFERALVIEWSCSGDVVCVLRSVTRNGEILLLPCGSISCLVDLPVVDPVRISGYFELNEFFRPINTGVYPLEFPLQLAELGSAIFGK